MMVSATDAFTLPEDTPKSSITTVNIAGILVYIYGLEELTEEQKKDVVVFFHIHGRTRTYKSSEEAILQILADVRKATSRSGTKKGFIGVTFDNRNHGARAIDTISIASWHGGNENHGQDMMSMIDGIALDIQTVMKYIECYLKVIKPTKFIVTGVSLGGHVTWNLLSTDPQVSEAIIVIGSPDLSSMMADRLGGYKSLEEIPENTPRWPASLSPIYRSRDELITHITGKKILILNGEIDTLVPDKFTRPFVEKYGSNNEIEYICQPNVGHIFSWEMINKMVEWFIPFLN
ncbi:Alpha/Beta hydrolase protein [Dipodascopsis uninucleata]